MNVLFWVCWVFSFLLLLLVFLGKGFRDSFGAGTGLNILIIAGMLVILIGSLVVRYGFKQKSFSLVLVLLPFVTMIIWYIIDQRKS